MLRDIAVTRIQDGLGFATRQNDKIVLRLQEAQRELEMGKTLPRFLLQQDAFFSLPIGSSSVALPSGFLRLDDSYAPYYITAGTPIVLGYLNVVRDYSDALKAYFLGDNERAAPQALVIRRTTVDLINPSDATYQINWQYYKAGTLLTTNIENEWLANAPEWLIGEAGWRMAMDARDDKAIANFDTMRKMGRAATFGEVVAFEESLGPLIMGANL